MREGWRTVAFADAVEDVSGGNAKTPQSEFLSRGRFAVVDQGKELIAGFVDDESRLCHAELPVIVFGDHTRCFKYIDFPFCIGADGVKVLRPTPGTDGKYLFRYLRQLRLTEGGYDRHFKYLKRSSVLLPPISEQRRIAEVLDRTEELRAERRSALTHVGGLTQAIFLREFGDPSENPQGFPVHPLIELIDPARPISYGILMPGPDQSEGVPYVRVVDMKDSGIDLGGVRRTTPAISSSYRRSLLKTGDLLLSIRGHVGRLAAVPPQLDGANITQDTARLAVHGAVPRFVLECLRSVALQRWMKRHVKGVAVTGINLGDVKRMPIMVPQEKRQHEFARRVAAVDKLKAAQRASLAHLDTLFASLQHRAFRGEL